MAGEGSSVMEQSTVAGVNGDGGALAGESRKKWLVSFMKSR